MNETHVSDISKINNQGAFEPKPAPESSAEGDFHGEFLSSLVMLMPESIGRTLASTRGRAESPARQPLEVQRAEAALPKDHANGPRAPFDSQAVRESAREMDNPGRQEAEKRQELIDEKIISRELKDKKTSAGEAVKGVRSAASTDKATEKFQLPGESAKESAPGGLKAQIKTESLEGAKFHETKTGSQESNQDGGGDSKNGKAKFSPLTEGVSETAGEPVSQGASKEGAFIPKASLQAQANNNALVGAIKNNGSINAPQVKVDITSLGGGLVQSTANIAATPVVKSAPIVRSTAFDNILVRQVSSRIAVTFKNNIRKATLTLNPPELGRLKVEIVIENSQVKATIATENVLVRDALEANLAQLRDALQAQGLNVDDLNIVLDDAYGGGGARGRSGSSKRRSSLNRGEGEGVQESATGIENIGNDNLDIFI